MKLQDAPTYFPPVVEQGKKFHPNWMDWFLQIARGVQDLFESQALAVQAFALTSGPGPITVSLNITVRKAAVLSIFSTVNQTWVTAAPSWLVEVLVDNSVVYTTGTIANTWQNVVSPVCQVAVTSGTHGVSLRWTAGNANAAVSAMSIIVIPKMV